METVRKVAESAVSKVSEALNTDPKWKDLERNRVDDIKPENVITTNFGVKMSDTINSLRVGERGPTIMDDFHFREKIMHFDHERTPERVVHARGFGAHGYFQVYESLKEFTHAEFLCSPAKKTPVFVRFSTVLGSKGSSDTVRDVRGFATKFYTDQGNFDIVGNNFPIFFIQDAIKFADIIHAGKPSPHNELHQAKTAHDNFWDFISLTPESAHMIMWALSDRAIPRSYRMMQGFGVHTFAFINKEGKRHFVKFHWLPLLGTHSLVWDEANKLNGVDCDFHRKDLYNAIEAGHYPEYELALQIVKEEDEHKFDFDLLDPTKIIPEEMVPLRRVGKMVLNRNTDNFFAETEQVAFCTSHLVPGIEVTDDPLLQGRLFSYFDTQITRLGGPNFQEIPINRPVCPVTNNQRDGMHRQTINKGEVNYFPNRFGCPVVATLSQGGYVHYPEALKGVKCRARGPKFDDHYSQPRLFYNSLSPWEKEHLCLAAMTEFGSVKDKGVRERMIDMLNHIDFDLATRVAAAVGVTPPTESKVSKTAVPKSLALSQEHICAPMREKNIITSRQVAFLVAEGYDHIQLSTIMEGLKTLGAMPVFVGPIYGNIASNKPSESIETNSSFLTCKSILFDAVVIVGGQKSIDSLSNIGDAAAFINEAFKHCKPISATGEGVALLAKLQLPVKLAKQSEPFVSDQGVVTLHTFTPASMKQEGFGKAVIQSIAAHRHFQREISKIAA